MHLFLYIIFILILLPFVLFHVYEFHSHILGLHHLKTLLLWYGKG